VEIAADQFCEGVLMAEKDVREQRESERAHDVAEAIHAAHPEFDEVPVIEADENMPPRPEEAVADADRV
jgi:hypothetical protein